MGHTLVVGSAGEMLGVAFLGIIAIALICIPALKARSKGYSFGGFFLLGLIAFPIALVAAFVVTDRSVQVTVGSTARLSQSVVLSDGREIPRGHVTKVLALEPADQRVAVLITAPDGSNRWIDRSMLLPA